MTRTGHGTGEYAASPNRIAAAEKRARALELRKAGATYEKIAEHLGYANRGNAQRAVQTALRDITAENAKEVLAIELERLDSILVGLWGNARSGHLGSIDRVLRIMERRSKYLGLDHSSHDLSDAERHTELVARVADTILHELDATPEQVERARTALETQIGTRPDAGFPRPEERERRHRELLRKAGYEVPDEQ